MKTALFLLAAFLFITGCNQKQGVRSSDIPVSWGSSSQSLDQNSYVGFNSIKYGNHSMSGVIMLGKQLYVIWDNNEISDMIYNIDLWNGRSITHGGLIDNEIATYRLEEGEVLLPTGWGSASDMGIDINKLHKVK